MPVADANTDPQPERDALADGAAGSKPDDASDTDGTADTLAGAIPGGEPIAPGKPEAVARGERESGTALAAGRRG